ncbi:MAG: MerR family transcriptional regulator [Gammaproteobacteria bacterium]|nr:MAG: MerR family transcriptional regulator [Gammaproteobacteria bacterium]
MAARQTKVSTDEHPIQVVARRTGLTADVIRVWERRYSVVNPKRANNSRRLYSDVDVQKLHLLRRATSAGRRIGDVAALTIHELQELVDNDESAAARVPVAKIEQRPSTGSVMEYFDDCLDAIQRLNSQDFYRSLNDASKSLGIIFLLEDLLRPLVSHIQDECRRGALRDTHYAIAMYSIRGFLSNLVMNEPFAESEYKLICASPAGPVSDIAALRLAAASKSNGWQAIFLGMYGSVHEIIYAQRKSNAQLIAIGITRPADDPLLPNQLRRLRNELDSTIEIAVTGSGAAAYFDVLQEIQANFIQTISELYLLLDRVKQNTRLG